MSRVALSALLAVAAVAVAQDPTGTEPLADKRFTYPTGIVSVHFSALLLGEEGRSGSVG